MTRTNRQLRMAADEPDWEVLPPRAAPPAVPGSRHVRELVELERQTARATLYLNSAPEIVAGMCAIIQDVASSQNFLEVHASPRRIVVRSVTPVFRRVEDSIEFSMPEFDS